MRIDARAISAEVSRASAFNNVVQRTSAALGLAMLTAMVDTTQAQLGAVPADQQFDQGAEQSAATEGRG